MIQFVRDNTLAVALLVGALLPLVTAVIQQPGWSKKTRSAVGLLVSLVAGIGTAAAGGDLDWSGDPIATVAAVMAAAEAAYEKLWQPTVAPAVERATVIGGDDGAADWE